ncbi:MAG: M28 family peptidase [Pirellulales bacterium]
MSISCCSTPKSSCSGRTIATSLARSTSPVSTWPNHPRTSTAGPCCWTWWVTPTWRSSRSRNSLSWRESRPLIKEIWQTAARLGIDEFVDRPKYEIQDDHLRLYYTAKIPSVDVIDFDYPAWHTEADRPEACSAESLAKVGWVMHEWLKSTASQQ